MAYREVTDQYRVTYGVDQSTAVRCFVTDSGGSVTALPVIGEKLGTDTEDAVIRVKTITKTLFGKHPSLYQYVIEYSSDPAAASGTGSEGDGGAVAVNGDEAKWTTTATVGGEIFTIPPNAATKIPGFKWTDGDEITQNISRYSFTMGIVCKRKGVRTVQKFELMKYSGKVNSATFAGFPAGYVLFEGAQLQEYFGPDGSSLWDVTLNFTGKVIPVGPLATPTGTGGWQYLFNRDSGQFETTNPAMYAIADLNILTRIGKGGAFT